MSSFPYTTGIPNPPNDPSVDAPNMQTNTNTIASWVNIDHYGFGIGVGGKHQIVTFPGNISPGAQGGLSAALATVPGTANASASQLTYTNSLITLPLSCVRAYATFNGTGSVPGTITPAQQFNVSGTINHQGSGLYVVTLAMNATTGDSYAVIPSCGQSSGGSQLVCNYTVSGSNTFIIRTFTTGAFSQVDSVNVSFIVIQL